ncbi:MAG: PAS domain-containing protein [Methanomicrobiales archaeon]|nr:PAS domain-containing protein [Methanomicrobiales archaeon]
MNLPASPQRKDLSWIAGIVITAVVSLLATLAGLLGGVTTAIPHLLYIPVVLAAYRYPRRGAIIAAVIGGIYVLEVVLLTGTATPLFIEALLRMLVIVAIGWLIATLSLRLREQESLYEGLFDHSEAGSILITDDGGRRLIERINWKAADLLKRKAETIVGTPAMTLWKTDDANEFFSRLSRERAVYAAETQFVQKEGESLNVLVSAALLDEGRAILTFFDISDRVRTEEALKSANDKLNILSRFSTDHLHGSVDEILDTVDEADAAVPTGPAHTFLERIRTLAWDVARQLFLTDSYKDLGTRPPVWIPVQEALDSARLPHTGGNVAIRIWTERLEIEADPLFSDVLTHLLENPLRYGGDAVRNIVVTSHETLDGLDLVFRDDGTGIPADKKEHIFDYDAGGHAGIGLFVCRQIAEVTGMTIREIGTPETGAVFVIHVPAGRYRIEGMTPGAPPRSGPLSSRQFPVRAGKAGVEVREILAAEFSRAEELWTDYHNTKGDTATDRIFAAFDNGEPVSLARCRKHPDGLEVDGVFTPVSRRGHGYANAVVTGLIEACGNETLYMHSVLNLVTFYGTYGFVKIDEKDLPQTIRDRFAWAGGEMEGANVQPMRRDATRR